MREDDSPQTPRPALSTQTAHMPCRLAATFRDRLVAADHALVGAWLCSGSPMVAEILAGAGPDWLMIDMEHAPNSLEAVQAQLQAVAPYPVTTLAAEFSGGWPEVPEG